MRFMKMSGAGNDFLVLGPDAGEVLPTDLARWIRRVCRRGLSVGADGVLFVAPTTAGRVSVRFHNPDGGEAFCGNGSRCAARFAHLRGFAPNRMTLETEIGDVPARVDDDAVRLELPLPTDQGHLELEAAGQTVAGRSILAGAQHFLIFVDSVAAAPLERWGPAVRRHPHFGDHGTNLDVVAYDDTGVRLRTWERGVEAETLACGSGAVAAAYAAYLEEKGNPVRVVPASGVGLEIGFSEGRATLAGDARVIFEAELNREATTGF